MRVAVGRLPVAHRVGGRVKGLVVSRGARVESRENVVRDVSRGVRAGREARGMGDAPGMTIASMGGTGDRE